MAYDQSKDVTIFETTIGNDLQVSVMKYNDGEPKLQIGPRSYTKKDGTTGYRKVGRMTENEVIGLFSLQGKISEILTNNLALTQ